MQYSRAVFGRENAGETGGGAKTERLRPGLVCYLKIFTIIYIYATLGAGAEDGQTTRCNSVSLKGGEDFFAHIVYPPQYVRMAFCSAVTLENPRAVAAPVSPENWLASAATL